MSVNVYWTDWKQGDRAWRLYATDQGLCRLAFPGEEEEAARSWLERHLSGHRLVEDRAVFERIGILKRLDAYFRGDNVTFADIPVHLLGTSFQQAVWQALGRIPHGEIRTYRDIAEAIGHPKAVRAVGAANGANPLPVVLACHRVVGSDRTLTGYRGGLRIKRELLALEGVRDVADTGHARFRF